MSVSRAGGGEQTRTAVLDTLDEAVSAGLRHLGRHARSVRVRARREHPRVRRRRGGLPAPTSRALEPELHHHHVGVANVAMVPDGSFRALDARLLFPRAKTSHARSSVTSSLRLGVIWTDIPNGIVEVEGVPKAAMEEMSTRRKETAEVLERIRRPKVSAERTLDRLRPGRAGRAYRRR